MLSIKENGSIYITRGDSAYITVVVKNGEHVFKPMMGDMLHFSVKKDVEDTEYIIHKVFQVGDAIVINPEDTRNKPFGKYLYDVQLTRPNGEVYTIIEPTLFYIKEEVTHE